MTEVLFPTIPGIGWSVTKKPTFSNRTQTAVSGRELKIADHLYPVWEWTLTFDFLRDPHDIRAGNGPGTGFDEIRTLMGFFLARRGSFDPFLFDDPTDNSTTGELLGTADGVLTSFQLIRTFGPYVEPIRAPHTVTIKRDGVVVASNLYTLNTTTGVVTFLSAPQAPDPITADFTYYFRVRFVDDMAEFENFMYQLWTARQIKLRSVLP